MTVYLHYGSANSATIVISDLHNHDLSNLGTVQIKTTIKQDKVFDENLKADTDRLKMDIMNNVNVTLKADSILNTTAATNINVKASELRMSGEQSCIKKQVTPANLNCQYEIEWSQINTVNILDDYQEITDGVVTFSKPHNFSDGDTVIYKEKDVVEAVSSGGVSSNEVPITSVPFLLAI